MKYHGYLISHGGHIRRNNEDNAYLNGHYRKDDRVFFWEYDAELTNNLIAAVFDGMGGEEYGELRMLHWLWRMIRFFFKTWETAEGISIEMDG